MNILVVLEHNQGSLHRLSKEAIVGAQKLGDSVSVLIMGEDLDLIRGELCTYDLKKVLIVNHELISNYSAVGYSEVIKQTVESFSPNIVIAGHTYQTRDFMPRVSARLGIPFIPDIISLSDKKFVKQILNAKLNAEISSSSSQLILSFQSAAFSEEDLKHGSCFEEVFEV